MRKHFLILMLLTLLPLAGWAAIAGDEVSVKFYQVQKEVGDADPTIATLPTTAYSVTGADWGDIDDYLTFKRTNESENAGSYSYYVEVSPVFATDHPAVTLHLDTSSATLVIKKKEINSVTMIWSIAAEDAVYNGSPFAPDLTLKNGETTLTDADYDWEWADPTNYDFTSAGDYVMNITGKGANYQGTATCTFTIARKKLSQTDLTIADIPNKPYKADYWKPALDIKFGETQLVLGADNDYTVSYSSNLTPGTAKATITLKNNYENDGTIEKEFTVTKYNLSNDADYASKVVVTGYENLVYNGSAQTPAITVKLNGTPIGSAYCTPSWDNNTNATTETSKAKLTITGNAPTFMGTKVIDVEIARKPLAEGTSSGFEWTMDDTDVEYDGTYHTKDVTATFNTAAMVNPTDFTYVAANNLHAGTADVIITGQGNFVGTLVKHFDITKKPIYVQPLNGSKTYGATEPAIEDYKLGSLTEVEPGVYAFVEDTEAHLEGTVELARVTGESVGTYKIYVKSYTVPDPDNDDYKIAGDQVLDNPADDTNKNFLGSFQINPTGKDLVLKFKEGTTATKVYGNENPGWTINDLVVDSGLVPGDDWEVVKTSLTAPVFAIESESVGAADNKVTVSGIYSANYPSVKVNPMPFKVTPRTIAVKVKNQTVAYGAALQSENPTNWEFDLTKTEGNDWNGNKDTEEPDILELTLSTVEDQASYAPGTTHNGVITATINNPNYVLPEANITKGNMTVTATTNLALDDSKTDNYTKIKAFNTKEGVTVTVKLSDRDQTFGSYNTQWVAKKYQALVLPFAVTPREISSQLGYAAVSVVDPSKATAQGIYFVLTWDEIPANTPFVVRTDEAIPAEGKTLTFTNKTIEASETAYPSIDASTAASGLGYKFTGAYEKYTIDNTSAGKLRVLGSDGTHHGIGAHSENHVDVIPFNAFMNLGSSVAPAHVSFFFEDIDGNTTAIRAIEAADAKQNAEGWYTINGVKLLSAPAQKGIYIHNGKKIVVK